MKEYLVIPSTFRRRLFEAQLNYIELIKKGVFKHDLKQASHMGYCYGGAAILEHMRYEVIF